MLKQSLLAQSGINTDAGQKIIVSKVQGVMVGDEASWMTQPWAVNASRTPTFVAISFDFDQWALNTEFLGTLWYSISWGSVRKNVEPQEIGYSNLNNTLNQYAFLISTALNSCVCDSNAHPRNLPGANLNTNHLTQSSPSWFEGTFFTVKRP